MKYTYALLGGSGNIGSALSTSLLEQGQKILIIGHDPEKSQDWEAKGAAYAVADVLDSERLRELFGQAERLFILNPPGAPHTDIVAVERRQIASILKALEGLPLQKIVAASTYGAQQGDDIADLGTLYELEQGLKNIEVPTAIIRSAYYMSNFAMMLDSVQTENKLYSLFPADLKLPMVAPEDIGHFAAELLQDERTGLFFIEGPEYYSFADAAQALGQDIEVVTIPESGWADFLKQGGFSDKGASSFMNMTRLTLDKPFEAPDPVKGPTTLQQYLTSAVLKTQE